MSRVVTFVGALVIASVVAGIVSSIVSLGVVAAMLGFLPPEVLVFFRPGHAPAFGLGAFLVVLGVIYG